MPQLLVNGKTDAAVLVLPVAMAHNWFGGLLAAITAAGAFAAFLSTSSGLVVSVAGVLSTDVLRGRVNDFRLLSVFSALVPTGLALVVADQDLTRSVGLAFAMAASTFAPLLLLGIWWRGLTAAGAASGLVTGGVLVLASAAFGLAEPDTSSVFTMLLHQPALVTVPIAFLVTVVVSRLTRDQVPDGVNRVMLRMHVPDRLGFGTERTDRLGQETPPSGGRHHR